MTDALLKIALAGTARHEADLPPTGTPLDDLIGARPGKGRERALLLTAGALAVYRQAGHVPGVAPAPAEPAPPEDRAPVSPRAARLIGAMLGGEHEELLPEALDRMRRAGLALPPELQPDALDARSNRAREALAPVLGARGRWLARFNPAWRWATEGFVGGEGVPGDAEAVWDEGTPGRRLEVLRRARRADSARACDWVASAWAAEKSDFRRDMLEILADGLSPDDEPLLESALDDRAPSVRDAAAGLLARIPGSALVGRMCARADAMLAYTRGFLGHAALTAEPPQVLPADWQRDGIELKPSQGLGERAQWLMQVLALVPLDHLARTYNASPSALVDAARRDKEWGGDTLEGFVRAAILHRERDWAPPLWRWCAEQQVNGNPATRLAELLAALTASLPGDVAEGLMRDLLGREIPDWHWYNRWQHALAALPSPWSPAFADAYLDVLGRDLVAAPTDKKRPDANAHTWAGYMSIAATALPAACFRRTLEIRSVSATAGTPLYYLGRQLDTFHQIIRIRQQLMEEIPQ